MELNKVLLYGNLTRDPESKVFQSGTSVTTFCIAVNSRGKDDKTMFINVKAWGKTGEMVDKYMRKGSSILIDGRLEIDEYETKDGTKRRDPVVIANSVSFGPKAGGGGQDRNNYSEPKQDQDLPF